MFAAWTGIGIEDYPLATRLDTRNVEGGHPGVVAMTHAVSIVNGGRPREARRLLSNGGNSVDGIVGQLLGAMYQQGDTSGTGKVARRLAQRVGDSVRSGETGREQLRALCALSIWRAGRGDFSNAREAADRLRRTLILAFGKLSSIFDRRYASLCASLLDAMRSSALRLPDAATRLAVADSEARTQNLVFDLGANLIVARVAEAEGNLPLALAAVRRRDGNFGAYPLYLSTFLREEGRLTALTGDTAGAIRAYQHYLALRPDPEPEMRADAEEVREEIGRLVQEPR